MRPVHLLFAVGPGGEFGLRRGLPWPRMGEDMAHFRAATMGRDLFVGRVTAEALPPLPGRRVRALSRSGGLTLEGVVDAPWTDEALVIGGASILHQALPHASRMTVTLVGLRGRRCDTWFRPDVWGEWETERVWRGRADPITVYHLRRVDPAIDPHRVAPPFPQEYSACESSSSPP